MKLLISSLNVLSPNRIHADSQIRVKTSRYFSTPGSPCTELVDVQLGFPARDREALEAAYYELTPVEVCFTQALVSRRFLTVDEVVEDGEPVQDPLDAERPWMVLARVVSAYEAENKGVQRTHFGGFLRYSDRNTTDSRTTVNRRPGAWSLPNNFLATPGKVGVYVSGKNAKVTSGNADPVHPLNGWVGKHPKNPDLLQLEAVNDLFDLDYFRRLSVVKQAEVSRRVEYYRKDFE